MKKLYLYSLFPLFCLLISNQSLAQNIAIPGHMPSTTTIDLPVRGRSMDRVRENFGNPSQEKIPVGNPPITEWVYDHFSVFFEYENVIHAVNLDTIIMPN